MWRFFGTTHAGVIRRLSTLRAERSDLAPHPGPSGRTIRRPPVSADPKVQPIPEPLTKAPFFSPRNVPLWVGLAIVAAVAGIVVLAPH
jgi:hypothetical protein